MRYFVLAADGNRYGPADVAALNSWITEGRLTPTMMLEEEGTGIQHMANSVPGLNFPMASPNPFGQPPATREGYMTPPAPQNPYANSSSPIQPSYPHGYGQHPQGANASNDLTTAYVFGVLGLICCPIVFSILAIVYAGKAERAGNPNTVGAKVLGYIGIALGVIGIIAQIFVVLMGARGF